MTWSELSLALEQREKRQIFPLNIIGRSGSLIAYGQRVKIERRVFLKTAAFAAISLCGRGIAAALDTRRPARFLPEERRVIEDYYRQTPKGKGKGLPPGLAKRGGNLPPGLQKHLEKNGQLPPGLQKRLEPLPVDLDRRLPGLPEYWERVVLERDVILLDRRTNRILDIIENIVALATGQ